MVEFGKILRRKREERNLTQAEVAERIGVSRQNVDSYESGYKIPSMRVVIATADLLHCTTDEMIGRKIS